MTELENKKGAIASENDVAISLVHPLTDLEKTYVNELLQRVEMKIRSRIPKLVERVEADEVFRANVVMIEADAVARVFRNPTGKTQESDGSYSYSVNFLVASGLLDVLPTDWRALGLDPKITSISGETDGYAKDRYGHRPDLRFQNGWPGSRANVVDW
jgi:hypothetical protein